MSSRITIDTLHGEEVILGELIDWSVEDKHVKIILEDRGGNLCTRVISLACFFSLSTDVHQ